MNQPATTIALLSLCISGVISTHLHAQEAENSAPDNVFGRFVTDGKIDVNFRYRFEGVDEDGFEKDAKANTLKTRLGWTSGTVSGFSAKLEFDNVTAIGSDNYNSTNNGRGEYPVVADPEGTEINQALVKYQAGGFNAVGGRQRINLDDQRFVGGVAWRQNEQTYDGVRVQYGQDKTFNLDYSYIENVNRIFGPEGDKSDLRGKINLLNGNYTIAGNHKLTGFFYNMDFNDDAASSNDSIGIRYGGKFGPIGLTASYAQQTDTGDNPIDYSADYAVIEAKADHDAFNWRAGYELLGSDNGQAAFITPLATLHKFQGFADKFLNTPANGIQDYYAGIGTKLGPVKLNLDYHQFNSDHNSGDEATDYGSEINFVAAYPINKQVTTLLKYADYRAKDYAKDTQKFWFMVQVAL